MLIQQDEVVDMRRNESKDEKNMMEIATANTKLSEPLKKLLKDVEELRTELKNYQKVQDCLGNESAFI